jgi:putative ABC transport system permease protein
MLRNYIKLTFRILRRNYFFTIINIIGLALGFASFYALGEYSIAALRSDQYHDEYENIARLGVDWSWTDNGGKTWGHVEMGYSRASILPQIKAEFPEVVGCTRILHQPVFKNESVNHGNSIVISPVDQQAQPRIFKEDKIAYADSNLFSFFSIPLIYGQPDKVLNEARYAVLSETTAKKYFGQTDPTGKLLQLNDSITLKVSGVYKDLPHYSHLNFELVISDVGLDHLWQSTVVPTASYVKLNHTDFSAFARKLNERKEYWADIVRLYPEVRLTMFVQPLAEIAFSKNFEGDYFTPKSRAFLLTLAFIALSILVMAWVNYVNLSVIRIKSRLKEIATRKVSGAGALDMVKQFITESFVITFLSILLSIVLLEFSRDTVSRYFSIVIPEFRSLGLNSLLVYFLVMLTGTLISGLYPAFISMAHHPRTLFALARQSTRKRIFPSLLTISQIVLAIIFIVLGFTVSLQLNHILNINTGITKDNVVIVEAPTIKLANYFSILHALKGQIGGTANVEGCAISHYDFSGGTNGAGYVNLKRIGGDHVYGMDANLIDEDFVSIYGIQLLAGRSFVKDDLARGILVSRLGAKRVGFDNPQDAIGAKVNIGVQADVWNEVEILGVFEDFQVTSLLDLSRTDADGRGIVLGYAIESVGMPERLSMRVSNNFDETIRTIQTLFERDFPGNAFVWYFLDDKVNQSYAHEKIARNQIILFTVLSLFIVCLGLLGMISNKAIEKTKELGIRKVLGAELHHALQILVSTLFKQFGIGTALGIPVAYYLTHQYLQNFSARINLQWWHFTLPVLILILVLLFTIAYVLWKAAKRNPLEALKDE